MRVRDKERQGHKRNLPHTSWQYTTLSHTEQHEPCSWSFHSGDTKETHCKKFTLLRHVHLHIYAIKPIASSFSHYHNQWNCFNCAVASLTLHTTISSYKNEIRKYIFIFLLYPFQCCGLHLIWPVCPSQKEITTVMLCCQTKKKMGRTFAQL